MSQEQPVPQKPGLFDVRGLPWWQTLLALAPIALIIAGGLIGAVFAVVAVLANIRIARTALATPVKALVMVAVDAMAVVAWLVVAAVLLANL